MWLKSAWLSAIKVSLAVESVDSSSMDEVGVIEDWEGDERLMFASTELVTLVRGLIERS